MTRHQPTPDSEAGSPLDPALHYGQRADIPQFLIAFRAVVGPLTLYNDWARHDELAKYSPKHVKELLHNDPKSMLLAWEGEKVAGFIVTKPDDGLLKINWFGVLEQYRGKALGDRLVKQVIADAPQRGYWKIWCDTRDENIRANNILARNGFIMCCRIERHWYGQNFLLWQRFLDLPNETSNQ